MVDALRQLTETRLSDSQLTPTLRRHLPALLVFCVGMAITYAVEERQAAASAREAAARFEARAREVSTQVAVALRTPVQTLHSLAGVLQVFPHLDPASFSSYARQLAQDDPAVVGVHFLPRVLSDQRSHWERQLGAALAELHGTVWVAAAGRELYLPIAALAPWEDPAWLGRDRLGVLGDNALQKSLQTGQVVASTFRPGRYTQPLISLTQRVCARGAAAQDCPPRARLGLAELWIRVEPILQEISQGMADEGMYVALYDLSAPQGEHMLYASGGAAAASSPLTAAFGDGEAVDVQLADRWLRVVVTRASRPTQHAANATTLASGTSISALLALLLAAVRSLRSLRMRLTAARQLGPYILERRLGAGSMGTVYKAHHRLLRRPTAVKLLERDHMDPGSVERFEREVQRTAVLCHPNTVAVYDFGRTSDGIFYYAMEYLDGVSLQKLVEGGGRQPPSRVLWILYQAAGALAEAHAAGLIHRDIKPANLMLCARGGVYDFLKVLDFGLVRSLSDPRVLEKNTFVGTPLYAAPEAYVSPQSVDERSDLYSLGATAFFLLAGREPFCGQRVVDVLEQHVSVDPPRFTELGVHDVPDAVEQLVRRCLEKAPECRPQSASELRRQVEQLRLVFPWTEHDARARWQTEHERLHAAPCPAVQSACDDIALGETIVP